jgi:redox-sensitive bicupin YhaK (pirin superfamily)
MRKDRFIFIAGETNSGIRGQEDFPGEVVRPVAPAGSRREFLVRTGLVALTPLLGCVNARKSPAQESRMSVQFSEVIPSRSQSFGGLSVNSLKLEAQRTSPVVVVDDFRARARTFGPHPHAGFSAITYIFPDSEGGLRDRDSLGNHVVLGPGGICWTQAGRGAQHEEIPASEKELHGLQVFVNLSAKNKLSEPRVFSLTAEQVPEWHDARGDRVRVVVGQFQGQHSPLVPLEPFTFLDAELKSDLLFDLEADHTALIYVRTGGVVVAGEGREQTVEQGQGLSVFGGAGVVRIKASTPANVIVMSGRELREPIAMRGPFIMNQQSEIDAAIERFKAGEMGALAPYAEG